VADVAALMLPAENKKIEYTRHNGNLHIGLNVGLRDCMKGWSTEKIAEQLKIWSNLLHQKITIVCIPHDIRGDYGGDLESLVLINKHLEGFPIDVIIPKITGAKEAKVCVSMLDIVVTRRMHLAVAALSCGVRVIGVGYANKFEGQFEHYAQEKFVVQDFGEVANLLVDICESRDFRIAQNLVGQALDLARKNLVSNI
jgi:polysaccharide pyruvyl transferase WcaK-like protein